MYDYAEYLQKKPFEIVPFSNLDNNGIAPLPIFCYYSIHVVKNGNRESLFSTL